MGLLKNFKMKTIKPIVKRKGDNLIATKIVRRKAQQLLANKLEYYHFEIIIYLKF